MTQAGLLKDYTAQVLSHSLGSQGDPLPEEPDPARIEAGLARTLKAWGRARPPLCLLLGLGSGRLAARLSDSLPKEVRLVVLELAPERARALAGASRLGWAAAPGRELACDTSPWALWLLMERAGFIDSPSFCLVNPELAGEERARFDGLRRLLSAGRVLTAPEGVEKKPLGRVAAGVALHPDEPGLEEFFAGFPDWISRIVCVWDGRLPANPAALERVAPAPRRIDLVRPLAGDFAAQRNAYLRRIPPDKADWIVSLDADEALDARGWEALALATHLEGPHRIDGLLFPRLTLYPDREHALMGYGLWPDLQLRLFRNLPGLHYVRPVHERLDGLGERLAVAVSAHIEHRQRLVKSEEQLRAKLGRFDAASGGALRHELSSHYPNLPRELLEAGQIEDFRFLAPPAALSGEPS